MYSEIEKIFSCRQFDIKNQHLVTLLVLISVTLPSIRGVGVCMFLF